jgi:hypothetical protein
MHSQIQYWRDNEVKKIHEEYEGKRRDIKDEAFLAGLSDCDKTDPIMQDINSRYKASYQKESAAVKAINDKAEKYDEDRLGILEAERKENVKNAWDNFYRRMGIKK